jgi:hypothetical protein
LKKKSHTYFACLVLFFSLSCIRQINVPERNPTPQLVVEGMITTDPPPYHINLSYSGIFTNAYLVPKPLFISDAKLTITDDLGDSTACQWIGNGTYQTSDTNFMGSIGRAYRLTIQLANGKTYVSKPERIEAVPPIDSVSVVYDSTFITDIRPTQLIISVNTHDPAGMRNYYRWTAFGYIPHKSWGGPCSISSPPCSDPFICTCHALCVQLVNNDQINILSDQFIDGKEILQQPVFYSPLYWFGRHFIEIKQYSLSQDVFIFWEQYQNQTNRTGSILDPLPASLLGNVYNLADSNEVALGLFSASAVYTKKIILVPFFLQRYYLESVAGEYVLMGDCHYAFANSLPDDADPTGWDSAQLINLH